MPLYKLSILLYSKQLGEGAVSPSGFRNGDSVNSPHKIHIVLLGVLLFALALCGLFWPLAAEAATPATHKVQAGEGLFQIAQQYSSSVEELASLNKISNPNLIKIGQVLRLPQVITEATHTVRSGETLEGIAKSHNTDINWLITRNKISNPNLLWVGQKIVYQASGSNGQQSSQGPQIFLYEVRYGESLSELATRYETSVSEISRLNNLSGSSSIFARDLLKIPEPAIVSRITYWANYYNLPTDLLKALTWWESGWNNTLVSSANAVGIGQLIPDTVDFVSDALIGRRLDPYNPDENIRMSARFFRYLMDHTDDDTNLALAAYYQGLTALRRDGVYRVTRPYVNGIQAIRSRFV